MFTPRELLKNLPFRIPQDSCCNCGSTENVFRTETELKDISYFVIGGVERTLKIELPFCNNCERSALRFRKNILIKCLIAFGLFWPFLGLSLIYANELPRFLANNMILFAALPAALITSLYYLTRRAKAPATSFYQPVFLKHVRYSTRGEVKGVALGFTNREFAKRVAALNTDFCEARALIIVIEQT
ncbi:hypothetical protein H8K35_18070 [Undibacterium sp. LX40W]|uniref:Uncharacterized protein n=1 Tax=Undibacterium nitidum TaxID=2762298 RepID=A0A923HSG8_9BURK|nr:MULTISPECIES: hypothetical protein [Undibacterium]MBC3883266.1 hypothetical protein [Undibacterium nitidum]MBC3893587.1 hypothetical protein [Undibacterium sp. LX40W]